MADKNANPVYLPRVVLITGATGGFGKAFAVKFAAAGCALILHGRSADKLSALAESLSVPVHQLVFDLKNREGTLVALENIPPEFQNIDLLINNAGGALGLDKAQNAELQDWEDMIEMNNTSLVRITRQLLTGMTARKRGHIINIGSTAGNYPYPGGNVYGAVKAFVKQFSLGLRADLTGTHIRVTNIEPGQVETAFSLVRFKGDKAKAAAVYANTENITADDIAGAVFWAATLPPRMNINRLEIMPTVQSFAGFNIERTPAA